MADRADWLEGYFERAGHIPPEVNLGSAHVSATANLVDFTLRFEVLDGMTRSRQDPEGDEERRQGRAPTSLTTLLRRDQRHRLSALSRSVGYAIALLTAPDAGSSVAMFVRHIAIEKF